MVEYMTGVVPTPREYIEFLTRSDIGSQYPRKDFEKRISRLLENVDVCVTAKTDDNQLVGVCLGVTDFSYFLFLTDLGVDRSCVRQGIGKRLVELAHESAGGEKNIIIITWANRKAIPFYERCGMEQVKNAVAKDATDYESFTVTAEMVNEI